MHLRNLLILGVFIELAILLFSNMNHPSLNETFKYAARYSGRFSAFVFLICFYLYATSKVDIKNHNTLGKWIALFALVHFIHLGFLVANVRLNAIPLETHKLMGGGLAYLLILIAPFALHKFKKGWQIFYFYYVSFVMIMTYVARMQGEFQGAEPHIFHKIMISFFLLACVVFGIMIFRKKQ